MYLNEFVKNNNTMGMYMVWGCMMDFQSCFSNYALILKGIIDQGLGFSANDVT